jgi:hypothetical protein
MIMPNNNNMKVIPFPGLDERYWHVNIEPKFRQALIKGGTSEETTNHVCGDLKKIYLTHCKAIPLHFSATESETKVINKILEKMAGHFKTIIDQLMIEIMKREIKLYEYDKEQ